MGKKKSPAQDPPLGSGKFQFRQNDLEIVGMVVAIKALLFLFAGQSFQILQNQRLNGWREWFLIWNRWDAVNYEKLARLGYGVPGETEPLLVFYPLFPWTVRVFSVIITDYRFSALVVSTLASIFVALLFLRLVEIDHGEQVSRRAVWFMFIFPTSYFLHIGYTESLFLMLVLGSVLAARKHNWLVAGLCGALACMTRANGLVLLPVLAVEAAHQFWLTRRWRWQWLWILVPALGFGVYLLLNKHVTGNAFAFTGAMQQFFFKSLAAPWTGINQALGAMNRSPSEAEMVGMQEFVFIVLGLVCTIVSWFKLRPAHSIWMTGNWLLFVSVTFVLSVPRYTLTMFPIFILFAMLAERRIWSVIITVWSILYLAIFSSLFVWGRWAF